MPAPDRLAARAIERPATGLYRPPASGSDLSAEATRWFEAEVRGQATPALIIVIGIADGHLLEVIERRAPSARLLVIEPDAAAALRCSSRREFRRWRESGRMAYLVGPSYAGADAAWRIFPGAPDAHALLVHPRLHQGSELAAAAALVKKIVFGVRANAEAKRRFAPRYLANVLRNVAQIAAGHDAGALAGAYAGIPAVITAAGPSLDTVIDEIAQLRDRALLIATDTTLRPLLTAGIAPHLAVGADPGLANARHFRELPNPRRTWLVAESALDRSASEAFSGRTLWFRLANHHPWPWLRSLGLDVAHIEMWGSVLTAAFEVACLAGCDPIVIAGADLAFTGGRPYCRGTTYEFDWAHNLATGTTLEDSWLRQTSRSQLHRVPDVNGADAITTPALQSFRDWMVARAARSGRRVINATGGGILYGDGIAQLPLLEAVTGERTVPEVNTILSRTPALRPSLASPIRDVLASLKSGSLERAPLTDWREFSDEGFDASQLEGALTTALNEVASEARPATAPGTLVPWHRLSGAETHLLPRLAEATERLCRGLEGLPVDASVPEGDRALLDALTLLQAARGALEGQDDPRRLSSCGSTSPVAGQYEWPEGLRWTVQLFEGLIGSAWNGDLPRAPEHSYFGGAAQRREAIAANQEPAAVTAVIRLAAEWMLSAFTRSSIMASGAACFASRVAGIEAALLDAGRADANAGTLRLECSSADRTVGVEIERPLSRNLLTRALTGSLRSSASSRASFFEIQGASLRATATLGAGEPGQALGLSTPVALTDHGQSRALVAYGSTKGAVCITPYAQESTVIRADGSVGRHFAWPYPVVGELPFGDAGAVAWDNGLSGGLIGRAHVMYRTAPGTGIIVEPIPVRPTFGVWWNGRVYWSCYPTPADTWVGIASWAPGEQVRFDLPGVTAFGLFGEHDALEVHPAEFTPHVGFSETLTRTGLKWRPDETGTQPFDLGAFGARASRARSGRWSAEAFPQSNEVRFTSDAGAEVWMVCHAPLRLAWAESSLLVSTVARELLMFEQLVPQLDAAEEALSNDGSRG